MIAHARSARVHAAESRVLYGRLADAHHYATIIGTGDTDRILIYTVRRDSVRHARTAIGLATDRSHFINPFFPSIYRSRLVLPPLLTGWAPNDSLLSVLVADSLGHILFQSGKQYASPYRSNVYMDTPLGHLRIFISVRPSTERAILVGGVPESRVPLLLGIFLGTALLTVLTFLQLRAELDMARQRANFAASVSHELRTPLAQILLFAETVRLGRAPSEERRHHAVDVIIREARRLMRLVENVLHVARAGRGAAPVTLEWFVVRHVVAETVEELAPLAREAGSEIALEPIEAGMLVNADPAAVRQMLLNVLDNAVKYGTKRQTIHVGAHFAAGLVYLWVDDEGPGVAAADRGRIWKPFVRLERVNRPGVTGAGIGLAVVRELVTAQRGRAWVERGTRGGARFIIALPGALTDDEAEASGLAPAYTVQRDPS
ncbi:MAG: HAMP domain-containing histidine kinase [Gemmatimonadaceae bacterium]|nr:HAMP domain-containing histidine kinase [Gemmatimonadaceae bacterium]